MDLLLRLREAVVCVVALLVDASGIDCVGRLAPDPLHSGSLRESTSDQGLTLIVKNLLAG